MPCTTCYVDNQGTCHHCGKPINADYGIAYYGEKGWQDIVDNWKEKEDADD